MKNETLKLTLPDGVGKFRLGLYTSDFSQPISLMRVMGPFSQMIREDRRLELVLPPLELPDPAQGRPGGARLNWDWLCQCDAVFMLHPESDTHIHCAALAWQLGIPLWAEYVDDIFNVEGHNPGWVTRRNKEALAENVRRIASWAGVVTCVSEYNRQAILDGIMPTASEAQGPKSKIEDKFLVLPEGCLWPTSNLPRRKCVSWRGLGSHAGDVDEAIPHLLAAAKAFPDWTWMFGGDPQILEELGKQLTPICGAERVLLAPYWPTPFDAMQAWTGQAPYLHVTPLADSKFNRSKSHLAWLEASAVGAAVIAPNHLPEWRQPGVIHYSDSKLLANGVETLGDVLIREMGGFKEGGMHACVKLAREAIYPDRTMAAMNQRRWAILRKLMGVQSPKSKVQGPRSEVPPKGGEHENN